MIFDLLFQLIEERRIRVLPVNENLADWQMAMDRYRLLPTDARITSTCFFHGITEITTFDNDFERVDSLRVVGMDGKQ